MDDTEAPDLDDAVDVALRRAYAHYHYDLQIEPIEFVIDGFQVPGITVVAGQPGVGKTSLLVSLYVQVAGLGRPDNPLKPNIRRKIVYVTEDPKQVKQILIGMFANGLINADEAETREWFIIKRAQRLNPLDVGDEIKRYREEYTYEAVSMFDDSFLVAPLIVLDTSNATIELQNENDNSEVGQAISILKQSLGDDTPLIIVTHLPKALNRAGITDITPRGASAWSGDVNAVQYVIKDDNLDDERFLVLGKRRFEAEFTEIRFETKCYFEETITKQGMTQQIPIRYAIAHKSSSSSRENAKQDAQKKTRQIREMELREAILGVVEKKQRNGTDCINRDAIRRSIRVKKQTALDLIAQLLEDGLLTEEPLAPGIKPPSNAVKTTIRLATPNHRTYANRDEV